MGTISGGSSTSSGGGSQFTAYYAPQTSAPLAITTTNVNVADTAMALTVTGKRFLIEYRWALPSTAGTTCQSGVGWSAGTLVNAYLELDYPSSSVPYANTRTTNNPSGTYTSATTPVMVRGAATAYAGTLIHRGVIEFSTSTAMTLTPYVQVDQAFNLYSRIFRVDVLA